MHHKAHRAVFCTVVANKSVISMRLYLQGPASLMGDAMFRVDLFLTALLRIKCNQNVYV